METMRKVETMELKGNQYAKVKDRLKLFREENPRGLVETLPTIMPDGQILMKARILRDKADVNSAEATGHAMGKNTSEKAFEKLETVALGRALANLGYLADGEIASFEEIEDFYADKQAKQESEVEKWAIKLKAAKDEEEMKKVWVSMPPFVKKGLEDLKQELKETLKPKKDGAA